jgi:hypothetical protein
MYASIAQAPNTMIKINLDLLRLQTPCDGTLSVGDGRLRTWRTFCENEPITSYYGTPVDQCSAHFDDDLNDAHCFSHVPGRWLLRCDKSPDTGRPIRLGAAQNQTYCHGVAAFAEHEKYNESRCNARMKRYDSEANRRAIERGRFDCIDPTQRVTYLVATRRIEACEEIIVYVGVSVVEENEGVPRARKCLFNNEALP